MEMVMKIRLLATGLMVATLALSQGVTTFAAPKVQTSLTLVDAGVFNFQSQTSALLVGDGFEKQGFNLNRKVGSNGQFDVTPGADRCANGFTGLLVGSFTESNGDTVNYTINNQLCPTEQPGVYSASGTYKITGGTGKYATAKGGGLFEGLADFVEAKYKCLLFGTLSY
jgi:hypothetical protein